MKSYTLSLTLIYLCLFITPMYGMQHLALQKQNVNGEKKSGFIEAVPSLIGNAIITASITRVIGDQASTMLEGALDDIIPAANVGSTALIINAAQNQCISSCISTKIGAKLISIPSTQSPQQMLAQVVIQLAAGYAFNLTVTALLKRWHEGTIPEINILSNTIPEDLTYLRNYPYSTVFFDAGARSVSGQFTLTEYANIPEDAHQYHCRIYQKNAALEILETLPLRYYSYAATGGVVVLKSRYTNKECERTYPRLCGFSDAIHKLKRAVLKNHITLGGKLLEEVADENEK